MAPCSLKRPEHLIVYVYVVVVVVVVQVVKQCCSTDGVEAKYIREEVLPDFFKSFWHPRMAMERKNYRQVRRMVCIAGCD